MARDSREFVKLDVGYLSNPKVVGLLVDRRPLAILLHIECIGYARQHRTDGVVPVVASRTNRPTGTASAAAQARLAS